MATGGFFRVQERPVYLNLETSAIRGDERQPFNFGFVGLQQFCCQTDSAIGIASDSAVGDGNVQQHDETSEFRCRAYYNIEKGGICRPV